MQLMCSCEAIGRRSNASSIRKAAGIVVTPEFVRWYYAIGKVVLIGMKWLQTSMFDDDQLRHAGAKQAIYCKMAMKMPESIENH